MVLEKLEKENFNVLYLFLPIKHQEVFQTREVTVFLFYKDKSDDNVADGLAAERLVGRILERSMLQ